MAILPSSCAGSVESAPLNAPIGVRAAETMTTSVLAMGNSVGNQAAQRRSALNRILKGNVRAPVCQAQACAQLAAIRRSQESSGSHTLARADPPTIMPIWPAAGVMV